MKPVAITCILTGAALLSLGIIPARAQDGANPCGRLDAKHKTTTHADRPTPSGPAPGRALIYFIRSGSMRGAFFQAKLAANEHWIGVLPRGNYYSLAEIEPGVVRLCATGSNFPPRPDGFAVVTAESGKSYYFEAKLISGFRAGVALAEIDEARGTALLAESRLVTFEEDQ